MGYEDSLSKAPGADETIQLNEIAYVWPEERRNRVYKELIKEAPRPSLSEEEIAFRILHPEEGRLRALRENEEENRQDPTFYPKKSS